MVCLVRFGMFGQNTNQTMWWMNREKRTIEDADSRVQKHEEGIWHASIRIRSRDVCLAQKCIRNGLRGSALSSDRSLNTYSKEYNNFIGKTVFIKDIQSTRISESNRDAQQLTFNDQLYNKILEEALRKAILSKLKDQLLFWAWLHSDNFLTGIVKTGK